MHVRVKICGITNRECADAAVGCGADAIGFVFARSPRQVEASLAAAISDVLPPFVARVAVLRHPSRERLAAVLNEFPADIVQTEADGHVSDSIHPPCRLLPVCHDGPDIFTRAAHCASVNGAGAILLEAAGRGGRGVAPSWDHAAELARTIPLVLAGGLDPENVGDAIRRVRPYGVDVSSGVETSPGVKSPERIADFLRAVRLAEQHLTARPEVLI